MKKYVIGVDFGTLSARALLVDAVSGDELAEDTFEYPHGVISEALPCGTKLPHNFALQHPKDYLDAFSYTVREVIAKGGISAEDVCGIGIDFTACTMLPVDENWTPLCMTAPFENNMHAYVKLWKHHAAQPYADKINALAHERGEEWINVYGGKVSSEWALSKILETLDRAPEVYDATYRFVEAADWLSYMLTGEETHSAAFAGYKWLYTGEGYPSDGFMSALDTRLSGIVGTKISENVLGVDKIAGRINANGASLTGLMEGTAVALPMIDAHASMPALGITGAGQMMLILGTSACHITNASAEKPVDGICGYVKDGVIPGMCTYEAGQASVGDIFDWFVKGYVPEKYKREAVERGIGVHRLLTEKADKLCVGESRLLALDWWSGNRSVLVNSSLSGMILGLNLNTKPEEIYRALIEATAYGLRVITERYEESGVEISDIIASGGIANKNEMMMQIYADVLGREIKVSDSTQSAALGSAVYAAVASGVYANIEDAADKLSKPISKAYTPNPDSMEAYNRLFAEYKTLHDYFGKENKVMERLLEFGR